MKTLGILLIMIVLIGGAGLTWFANALIQQKADIEAHTCYAASDVDHLWPKRCHRDGAGG
jgi:hypothetical protein